ncbi:MAG: asparaginase [Candidatus Peribacteraceae bacterium]|nr:asparaginase [Candidatus Peribacteraceae bacterium]
MRPSVAVLYVGGSIGMVRNRKTGRIEPVHSLVEFHRFIPDVQREVKLEFKSIANVGSSEVTPEHWVEIAQMIKKLHDQVDGFVIIHGTNTMAYTAAALTFALRNLGKPVVLTGSIMPIDELGSDGPMNLTYAIRTALLDIAEVCVALGPRVLRGSRAKKAQQSLFETFESPKFPALATFNPQPDLHPWRTVRRKRTLQCSASFDPHVASVTLHPGMPDEVFNALLASKPSGIVLRAYGLGMLPEHLFPWIRKVTEQGIPLVITSQLLRGKIDLHLFRKQLTLEQLGVISGKDMTYECAVVKLMWALTQSKNLRRIRELMETNLTGELTV